MNLHHKIFYQFERWEGEVEAGFTPNFLGCMTRESYFPAIMEQHKEKRFVATDYPAFDEEYFEWIDLLEAVTGARGQFIMIELGAGWGRWLINGALALRHNSDLAYKLIGVEAEPTHFRWMKVHFRDNGLDPDQHQLIEAAVSDKDGSIWFLTGIPDEYWGQRVISTHEVVVEFLRKLLRSGLNLKSGSTGKLKQVNPTPRNPSMEVIREGTSYRRVKAVSLTNLLEPLDQVDLIDLDIQGAELVVLNAAAKQLDRKVKRIHIGTHGHEIECGLRRLFTSLQWKNLYDFGSNSEHLTAWGPIKFQDGLQTWVNRNLSEPL